MFKYIALELINSNNINPGVNGGGQSSTAFACWYNKRNYEKGGIRLRRSKGVIFAAGAIISVYGLAWGYGSAFQDAPPAQSPAYGHGYKGDEGKNRGVGMERYSSSAKEKGKAGNTGSMGGPPSGGSMGGSSSGGR